MEEKGRWITIKGNHIFIKKGQKVYDAFQEWLLKNDDYESEIDDEENPDYGKKGPSLEEIGEIDNVIKRESEIEKFSGKGRYLITGPNDKEVEDEKGRVEWVHEKNNRLDGEFDSINEALAEYYNKFKSDKIVNIIVPDENNKKREYSFKIGRYSFPQSIERIEEMILDKSIERNKIK